MDRISVSSHKRSACLLGAGALLLCALALVLLLHARAGEGTHYAQMPGTKVSRSGAVTMDYSNASQGYVAVKHAATSKKLKLRVKFGNNADTYDLTPSDDYSVFPLKYGPGQYTVLIYKNVEGKSYAQEYAHQVYANITDPNVSFLYPNQIVWYTEETKAIELADDLCKDLETDMEKISKLYNYVKNTINYDHIKALNVKSGYIPDIDATLDSRMGICYDYSALLGCMLRSQGIYTQLVMGTMNNTVYHAWNKVYIDGKWKMLDATTGGKYKSSAYVEDRFY